MRSLMVNIYVKVSALLFSLTNLLLFEFSISLKINSEYSDEFNFANLFKAWKMEEGCLWILDPVINVFFVENFIMLFEESGLMGRLRLSWKGCLVDELRKEDSMT